MAARTTIELMPLLASALISAPSWALEACVAVDGDTLRCGHQLVRVRGLFAPEIGEPGAERAKERLQNVIGSGRVRLDPRAYDRHGRLIADVYVSEVRIRQRHIGPRGGKGLNHDKRIRHDKPGEKRSHKRGRGLSNSPPARIDPTREIP